MIAVCKYMSKNKATSLEEMVTRSTTTEKNSYIIHLFHAAGRPGGLVGHLIPF